VPTYGAGENTKKDDLNFVLSSFRVFVMKKIHLRYYRVCHPNVPIRNYFLADPASGSGSAFASDGGEYETLCKNMPI